jgi:hypothetical protein
MKQHNGDTYTTQMTKMEAAHVYGYRGPSEGCSI